MLLAHRGYEVDIYERNEEVGGRNARIQFDGFTFDLGPTFLMMKFILEEMFELTGRKVEDYLDIRRIEPMYRLKYGDGPEFFPTGDRDKMLEELARVFPGSEEGYLQYMAREERKLDRILPCLQVPYAKVNDLFATRFIKALPVFDAHRSLYQHLSKYFDDEQLKLSFTFQAKYLGMSPWQCPATFSIISFVEHSGGIHHPIGGLHRISHAMAKVVEEEGGRIHLGRTVEQVRIEDGDAVGLRFADGEEIDSDLVVLNADFGHAMNKLVPPEALRKWTPEKLGQKGLSCSTFMLYLGVGKRYDELSHHSILFAEDYERNVREVAETMQLSEDPSIYVQNACVTDPGLAPEGSSAIYVLVPVPNNRSGIDWEKEKGPFRNRVLELLERRGSYVGLRDNIVAERMITPADFEHKINVYKGAVFNLAHTWNQMLFWRPSNRFTEIGNCYLVGGGTHPGSGLPTIYESGRISADLISAAG
jgi:phytoene desaturase